MAQLIRTGMADLFPMEGRSEGRHVSTAIRKLCLSLGHFDDRDFPTDMTRFNLGNAFEAALIKQLADAAVKQFPNRYIQPGEQEKDGVFGTPDLIDLIKWRVVEIKLTWATSNQDPEGKFFWKYWRQGESYAHMLGMDSAEVWVCHINGNYKYGKEKCQKCGEEADGPHMHVWEPDGGKFTEGRLLDTWSMIRANA